VPLRVGGQADERMDWLRIGISARSVDQHMSGLMISLERWLFRVIHEDFQCRVDWLGNLYPRPSSEKRRFARLPQEFSLSRSVWAPKNSGMVTCPA
jgi:hypothetical protein